MPPKPKSPIPVVAVKHKDKRANIPTKELRGFVEEDEKKPKAVLYPRDPSLDPQLVWKGKDEQDRAPLAVPAVPIYIQEKIHPQAIIEEVRAESQKGAPQQASLFADFNGIQFEDLIDFYHHEQNWANRFILGDSLLVMTSLAEKEGLKGKVQCLYFDPPYGINFGSNWQVSTRKRDVKDGKAEDATRQPEQIRAFRDTWKLGIHSYLAYLRDRLTAARELLTESGSVFVQIGDENVHLVRAVMDEVFGSENFVSQISFAKTTGFSGLFLSNVSDYLILYAKNANSMKYRQLFRMKEAGEEGAVAYRPISEFPIDEKHWGKDSSTRLGSSADMTSQGASTTEQKVIFDGKEFYPPRGLHWKTTVEGMQRLIGAGRVFLVGNTLRYLRLQDDFPVFPITSTWTDTGIAGYTADKIYVVQTLQKVVERCILMATDPGDLVLDPTCGSGTTAFVAEQWGRRWITIDTSRVAIALARTRLMAAKFPYYLLADSPEGEKQRMKDEGGRMKAEWAASKIDPLPAQRQSSSFIPHPSSLSSDIKRGFVSRRVPHVTLKSIANNPDIKEGMSREEIDRAIAKHADTELLYDQPYEDGKRIRVTGPFTVESLSPHRTLECGDLSPLSGEERQSGSKLPHSKETTDFVTIILENLRKAGIQNTRKGERLKFDRLESFSNPYLHAIGEYSEVGSDRRADRSPDRSPDGAPGGRALPTTRRVAICIGPEHGTVSPELVKEAAKEAVQGVGFDLLVVCGFAFDPHVTEEAKRFGKLQVLIARMNPDLAMGDELLKKTGAGNLFMVFGELDMEVKRVSSSGVTTPSVVTLSDSSRSPESSKGKGLSRSRRDSSAAPQNDKGEQLVVTIKGVDVYDPTTGQIRNSSTDDIACWFIDTDYNGESFFVRQAYFTGADEPYEKLKRALRAEIDESAWQTLYSTTSRPFPAPKTGKIAVKVINHYGDEVLKVWEGK